jgi:hypothetical protein
MAGILKVDTIQNANADNIITQTNSTTLTIGTSGDTVTLAAGATSSGFGATYNGAVNWDTTKKTTGFTAVNGVGYFCDTTSTAFTATLPLSPSAGDIVAFSDYTGTWATNNLTVGRNSSNINGTAADLILNTNNTTATLIYVDATEGWRVIDTGTLSELITPKYVAATGGTITTCGSYKIHSFTGPGTFTVSCAGNPAGSSAVDYLVVAGGGSGGNAACGLNGNAGGGGGGGFRESKATGAPWTASPLASSTSLPVSVQGYPITVGGGGASKTTCGIGNVGNPSIFSTITSAGGGAGGRGSGGNGGSGGGAADSGVAGTGNTPPTSPPQGNPGGSVFNPGTSTAVSGGGGGATVAGSNGNPGGPAGPGGAGATTSISTSPTSYAGGGGGGGNSGETGGGTGGTGGGGAGGAFGGPAPLKNGVAGSTNTGGGGGATASNDAVAPLTSGAGGSGIVVIRYKFQ